LSRPRASTHLSNKLVELSSGAYNFVVRRRLAAASGS
jgi:hypothetical protein